MGKGGYKFNSWVKVPVPNYCLLLVIAFFGDNVFETFLECIMD
jgi:hypothetical protein